MDACDSSRFCPRGKDAGAREENAWAVGRELEFAASTKILKEDSGIVKNSENEIQIRKIFIWAGSRVYDERKNYMDSVD